jgi:gliding motility-associated-like protein
MKSKRGAGILLVYLLLAGQLLVSFKSKAALKADFTTSTSSGCSPLVVTFTSTSTGSIANYTWKFGNGNTSTGALKNSVGAIYYTPGFYNITLYVTDASGNKDSITKTKLVEVFKGPRARFSASPGFGCKPLTVVFNDSTIQGSSKIVSRAWDFGDGNISSTKSPSNTYTATGKYTVSLLVKDSNGCSDIITKAQLINVSSVYNIHFAEKDTIACSAPLISSFKAILSGGSGTPIYSWQFGDGDTSSTAAPSHTYLNPGKYSVSLKVSDPSGCSGAITKTNLVEIRSLKANFSNSPNNGCPPLYVSFNNLAAPRTAASYFWDFGDGSTSTDSFPYHNYTKSGAYTVKLIISDPSGCKDSIITSNAVIVKKAPSADFTANDSLFCQPPLKINFIDKSVGAASVLWDFGDGKTSTVANSVHTYASAGTYTIKFTATASNGCSVSSTKNSFIKIIPPVANFTPIPFEGCIPLKVSFKNFSKSVDTIIRYHWDFGNGDTSSLKNPIETYTAIGLYKATLTIYTSGGCVESTYYYPIKAGTKPQSDFTATPLSKCIDTVPVLFTNLTNTHSVKADSFFWSFGDGQHDSAYSPPHIYDYRPSKLTITLVSWSNGCADTLIKKDYIELLPAWAHFVYTPPPCKSDTVQFYDSSVGATSLLWKFDDGTTSNLKNPAHPFSVDSHLVVLYAFNSVTGCRDTFFQNIVIPPKIKAGFFTNDTNICIPYYVHFTDTSNVTINAYSWDFGNGKKDTVHNPTVLYDSAGIYTVTLTAIDKNGCTQTITRKNYITASHVKANFSLSPLSGCTPLPVHFIDSSSSTIGKITSRSLDFGDGTTTTLTSGTYDYTYSVPPLIQRLGYNVKLTVVDDKGCSDNMVKVVIPTHPRPDFSITPSTDCSILDYYFSASTNDTNGIQPFKATWDFGDGTISHALIAHHTYSSNGTYLIKLKVIDANYCPDSISKTLIVRKGPPKSLFSANPTRKNCPPLITSFKDSSLPSFTNSKLVAWKWTFGDGTSSTLQNPFKTYTLPGKYSVSLVVTDSIGCSDSTIVLNLVVIKGPTGTYRFDKYRGCPPLLVNFSGTSTNTKNYTWDLADGTILSGQKNSHTYTNPGVYHPSLILTDSAGCKVALPPKDSITIYSLPVIGFNWSGLCFNYPTLFSDNSTAVQGTLTGFSWDFGDSVTINQQNPGHIYKRPDYFLVKHTATNSFGCTDSLVTSVKIGGLKVNFGAGDTTVCIGTTVDFKDLTFADTAIQNRIWGFGDADSSGIKNPSHLYTRSGKYDIYLKETDYKGCTDTLLRPKFIIVGDTIPPQPVVIYRVSVESDVQARLEFQPTHRLDFGSYNIFRDDGKGFNLIQTIRDVNDTIIFDGAVNTLRNSYCYKVQVETFCGYKFPLDSSKEHCTINLKAKPGINKNLLSWNHYKGWDTIRRYFILRAPLDSNNFMLIDSVAGSTNNYEDTNVVCFKGYTYHIQATETGGYRQFSWSDTAAATPIHAPNANPNEVVRATVVDEKTQVDWNYPPRGTKVEHFFLEKSEDGRKYAFLKAFPPYTLTYTDDEVKVNEKSYWYRMNIADSCGDVSPYSNFGKTILLKADTGSSGRPHLHWSEYKYWKEGVDYYDVERKNKNGSFTNIGRTASGELEFDDNQTNLNSLPEYCFHVIAHRNDGFTGSDNVTSTSNVACMHVTSYLEVPTAFSPNKDTINDFYLAKGIYIANFHLKIFNRWGELVFETYNIDEAWDGSFKGKPCTPDIYLFQADGVGADAVKHFKQGSITLLK